MSQQDDDYYYKIQAMLIFQNDILIIQQKRSKRIIMLFFRKIVILVTMIAGTITQWSYIGQIPIPSHPTSYCQGQILGIKANSNFVQIQSRLKSNNTCYILWGMIPSLDIPVTIVNHPYYDQQNSSAKQDSPHYYFMNNQTLCLRGFDSALAYVYNVNNVNAIIISCAFVYNSFDSFVIIFDPTVNTVNFVYLSNNYTNQNISPTISVPAASTISYQLCNDTLLLLTTTGVNIYAHNSSFTLLKSLGLSVNNIFHIDCQKDFRQNYFLTNITNNYSIVFQGTVSFIKKLLLHYPDYILIAQSTVLHQVDIKIQQTIQAKAQSFIWDIAQTFNYNNVNYILFGNYSFTYIDLWITTSTYSCVGACSSCFDTYFLNTSTNICERNLNNSDSIDISNSNYQWLQKIIKPIADNISIFLQISSNKLINQQTIFFIMLLDDIEYYQYHQVNYSKIVQFVFYTANYINNIRLGPQFLNEKLNYKIENFTKQDQIYQRFIILNQNKPSQYYFLCSSSSIYIGNLISNGIQFFIIKIIYLILIMIHKKYGLFKGITKWLDRNTRWWCFLIVMMESNMTGLSFNFFLQFTQPLTASFYFVNKLNLVSAIIIFFSFFTYAFISYLLIFAFFSKSQSQVVLNMQAKQTSRGYFCQSFCRITRNLIRGFFHAYFLNYYKTQIIGLAISSLLSIIAILISRKNYKNKWFLFLFVMYYILFLGFDTILAIFYLNPQLFKETDYNLINLINLCAIIIIVIALYLTKLILLAKFLLSKAIYLFCKKNKQKIEKQLQTKCNKRIQNTKKLRFVLKINPKQSKLNLQQKYRIKKQKQIQRQLIKVSQLKRQKKSLFVRNNKTQKRIKVLIKQ